MAQIQVKQYPKLIESFARENFNIKTLLGILIALLFLNSAVLVYVLRKGPVVVPLQADGTRAQIDGRVTEPQIKAALLEYIEHRYTWSVSTVSDQVNKAQFFVAPTLVRAFKKDMVSTLKYVHDKKVTQRA